ncbi:hypothetical protein I4F81_006163 [Pyropia yezoensis]|uniref:Uncharacterized protein n=1 Tax=Pyropia yezoensis TaxID=2788 RepID=A0ACC3C0D8_PYRYE|nr:hypothetical protein I4F81_006163 [Neopyropia yezoensis]
MPLSRFLRAATAPPVAAITRGGAAATAGTGGDAAVAAEVVAATRLRGGDSAAPRTLLETLSSAALARLLKVATVAYAAAVIYTVVLIIVSHIYSVTWPAFFTSGTVTVTLFPGAVVVFHVALGATACAATVAAAVALSYHVWAVPAARRADEQTWTLVLLWAAAIHAVPFAEVEGMSFFRDFATFEKGGTVEDSGNDSSATDNPVLQAIISMGGLAFAAFVLWYGSTSVASHRKLHGSRQRLSFYGPRTVLLVGHVAARAAAFFALSYPKVIFSVFPVASVAYLLRLAVAVPLREEPRALGVALGVLAYEALLVGVFLWETAMTGATLRRASFARTRSKRVAHRFFLLHATRMAAASFLCVLLTAVAPPIGLLMLSQRFGLLLPLVEGLGHEAPFRLLVATYAVVEAVLAMPPHVISLRAVFSRPPRPVATKDMARGGDWGGGSDSSHSSFGGVGDWAEDASSEDRSLGSGWRRGEGTSLSGALARPPAYRTRLREDFDYLFPHGRDDRLAGHGGRGPGRRLPGRPPVAVAPPVLPPTQRRVVLHPGTFTLTTAAKLLNMAWLAYTLPPPPTPYLHPSVAWRCPEPLVSVARIFHPGTDTYVLFVALPDRLVISFRGTASVANVGDSTWAALLNSLVPIHWRCMVARDVITTVPFWRPYAHAGTAVLLDLGGDLFIDPLAVAGVALHGGPSSLAAHSRGAYMLALSAVGVARWGGRSARRRLFWRWTLPPPSVGLLGPPRPPRFRLPCLTWDADVDAAPRVGLAARLGAGAAGATPLRAAVVADGRRRRRCWWRRLAGRPAAAAAARPAVPAPVLGRWARLVGAARAAAREAAVAASPRRAARLRPLPPLETAAAYTAAAAARGAPPGVG